MKMVNPEWTLLPEKGADLPVDFKDPGKFQIAGLFRQTWVVDGVSRSVLTYAAEGLHYNCPCLIIAPPSHLEIVEFLQTGEFIKLAERNQILLVILETLNGAWDFSGKDADFMNSVYKNVQAREYYVVMQDCIYAAGFGDGASIAQQAVMKMTSEWSGLVTYGNFNDYVMLNAGNVSDSEAGSQEEELFISSKKCQLPVWMLFEHEGKIEKQVISYWKQENKSQAEPLYDKTGTEIFLPQNIKKTSKINEDLIAQTRITRNQRIDFWNIEKLEYVWQYIGAARRHRGYGNKLLRYYRNPMQNGATYHTIEVDGITREWYEYVPDAVASGNDEVPLVVAFHGRGGNGEPFFDITDMSTVAEERNFIAVFPTADFYQIRQDGLRSVRVWNGNYEGKQIDSEKFVRTMIEDIKGRHRVDNTRIFACGQSSGGYMASYCALAASDLFTAVSPWSGFSLPGGKGPFSYHKKHYFQDGHVPFCMLIGSEDNLFDTSVIWPFPETDTEVTSFLKFLIEEYNLSKDPGVYNCNPITYYVWENAKGTPMVKIGIVDHMPHANYAEESRIAYDEFFSKFSRNEQGELLYMGRIAE